MEAFAYANPTSLKEAIASLGTNWDDAAILAGGTDLITLMKQYVYSPKKVVNIKGIKELKGIERTGDGGFRIGAAVTIDELLKNRILGEEFPALRMAAKGLPARRCGTWAPWAAIFASVRALVFPQRIWPARPQGRQEPGGGRREPVSCHSGP